MNGLPSSLNTDLYSLASSIDCCLHELLDSSSTVSIASAQAFLFTTILLMMMLSLFLPIEFF